MENWKMSIMCSLFRKKPLVNYNTQKNQVHIILKLLLFEMLQSDLKWNADIIQNVVRVITDYVHRETKD